MLIKYQMLTRRLVNDPTFALCNDFDLRDYINIARGQIAAIGNCIPGYGTLAVNASTQQYPFSQTQFPGVAGAVQPLAIETVNVEVGVGGQRPLNAFEWARFNRYELGQVVPKPSRPRVWSQFGQGTAGSFFINALDGAYTLAIKAKLIPIDLVDDTTPEAIPPLWTDAIPWYAAWYYLSAINPQLAQTFLQGFQQFMAMARGSATPDTQIGSFTQAPDPYLAGRLGLGGGGGAQGGGRGAQPRQQSPPTAG